MNKNILAVVAIVLVLGGGFLLMNNSDTKTDDNGPTPATTEMIKSAVATIVYTSDGFTPNNITVSSGDVVAVRNDSQAALEFESNPHPAHVDDTDLNVGAIKTGETKAFTATKTGTFGFHNHFKSDDSGSITIE